MRTNQKEAYTTLFSLSLTSFRTSEEVVLFESVEEWLESIKMGRYSEVFRSAGVVSLDSILRLTVQDLAAIGVTLIGHQRKIISSITAIRRHLAQGFLV